MFAKLGDLTGLRLRSQCQGERFTGTTLSVRQSNWHDSKQVNSDDEINTMRRQER